jgi:hypothetical protein
VTFDIIVDGEKMRGAIRLQPSHKRTDKDAKLKDRIKDWAVKAGAEALKFSV